MTAMITVASEGGRIDVISRATEGLLKIVMPSRIYLKIFYETFMSFMLFLTYNSRDAEFTKTEVQAIHVTVLTTRRPPPLARTARQLALAQAAGSAEHNLHQV